MVGAIQALSELFNVGGYVIPVTLDHVSLLAEYSDGTVTKSEHLIDEPLVENDKKIVRLFLDKSAVANPEAIKAIKEADFILLGPGDLYTTTIANIIIGEVARVVSVCKGKLVLINNLMTKKGQTDWMTSSDLVNELAKYCLRKPDVVLTNSADIPQEILEIYRQEGEEILKDDLSDNDLIVVRADLISGKIEKESGDILKRSLIRHDSKKLAEELYKIFNS